ncbi:MAG TPA: anti-sigma factor, partial [Chloroflexota bacterium]|nr:anti-sigma factor [Chloroflexota bacterium]
ARVRAHLAVCESCRQAAAEFRQVVEVLPVALADEPGPRPDLRDRIIASSQATPQLPPAVEPIVAIPRPADRPRPRRFGWSRFGGWLAAAALFLVSLGLGAWNVSLQQQIQALQRPAAQVSLVATADGGGASGRLALATEQPGLLSVHDLPPPESGRVYEAWVINAGGPLPAGTFVTTPDGQGSVLLTAPVHPGEVVAVTAEPSPGTAAPSGKVLLKGSA